MECKEVTKSKRLEKKRVVSKKGAKCKNYGNEVRFNTFTSNITIQSKCIIWYRFQWIEYPNISTDLPAVPKFWHLVPRLGLHLNMDANYWAGHHKVPGNTILVYTQLACTGLWTWLSSSFSLTFCCTYLF